MGNEHAQDTAIVTASYAGDFERCRLLCETIDHHVIGATRHLLLVSGQDVALFRQLAGPHREVVDERDILPSWLRDLPDPLSGFRRRIWLSLQTPPLRGWHVQQLRRIAIADHVGEGALLFCDSDTAFTKEFDCSSLWHEEKLRLFRRQYRLRQPGHDQQIAWARSAASALGLPESFEPEHDYIATMIAWRADTTRQMMRHIEKHSGRHWIAAITASRSLSECMIYGCYADEVLGTAGHFHDDIELCHIYWNGPELTGEALSRFIGAMSADQVAIGLQSFIGTDIREIRKAILRD